MPSQAILIPVAQAVALWALHLPEAKKGCCEACRAVKCIEKDPKRSKKLWKCFEHALKCSPRWRQAALSDPASSVDKSMPQAPGCRSCERKSRKSSSSVPASGFCPLFPGISFLFQIEIRKRYIYIIIYISLDIYLISYYLSMTCSIVNWVNRGHASAGEAKSSLAPAVRRLFIASRTARC